jgi:hypothetical protein
MTCGTVLLTGGEGVVGGGTGVGAGARAATTADVPEVADAVPRLFVAVTVTRIVEPIWAEASWSWEPVAPGKAAHAPPPESQRFHWYVYEIATPDQLPGLALSV